MLKLYSSNYNKNIVNVITTLLLGLVVFLFLSDPSKYMLVFFDGLTIWAHNVLPVLFPFALLTTLYTKNCKIGKFSISKILFGTSCDSVFIASISCGYPVGARAISELNVDEKSATSLCSFCSTPNPIFIIATIGSILSNATAITIIVVSQVLAMIFNGWIYTARKRINIPNIQQQFSGTDFGNTLTNSVLVVLSVGGLIALFFMLSEMLQALLPFSTSQHPAIFFAIGLLEMTSGIIKICNSCDIFAATVCTSALLAFGGICIALQCYAFVSQKGVKLSKLLQMKSTQCAFATLSAFVLGKIFL